MKNIINTMYLKFLSLPYIKVNFDQISVDNNFQYIGIFDDSSNIWYNAWSIYTDKKIIHSYKSSRDLLKYAINLDIDLNNYNSDIIVILRSILINSKIFLTNKNIQIELLLAIITYYINSKSYSVIKSNNLFYYIVEKNT